MAKIVIFQKNTSGSSFKVEDRDNDRPIKDQLLIKLVAFGVNDIDVTDIMKASPPEILGYEGYGKIEAIGPEVSGLQIGDRVIFALGPVGSYREYRCISQQYVVRLPDNIDPKLALAVFFKGMLAHSVTSRAFCVRNGIKALVQDITTPLGQVIAQFAKANEASLVIGGVSNAEDGAIAQKLGYKNVVCYQDPNFIKNITTITDGTGVHVVYDNIGKESTNISMQALTEFGVFVSCGYSPNPVQNISFQSLYQKSIFFTAPSVMRYKALREEFILTAAEIFHLIEKKVLHIQYQEFNMDGVADAINGLRTNTLKAAPIVVL